MQVIRENVLIIIINLQRSWDDQHYFRPRSSTPKDSHPGQPSTRSRDCSHRRQAHLQDRNSRGQWVEFYLFSLKSFLINARESLIRLNSRYIQIVFVASWFSRSIIGNIQRNQFYPFPKGKKNIYIYNSRDINTQFVFSRILLLILLKLSKQT